MYRKILLIADPSMQRTPAYRRAIQLARASGAELHICLFEHHSAISAVGRFNEEVMALAKNAYLREREEWLDDVALAIREEGLKVRSAVIWGLPLHEKILAKVLELKPDLVIKDVHLESGFRRLLYAPLDWQLLRLCPAPLLLVNPASAARPRRVLAAVDPIHPWNEAGELNERIVQEATAIAIQCDATAHLLYAFEGPPPAIGADLPMPISVTEVYEQLRTHAAQRFTEFGERCSVPADRRHLLDGPPPTAIAAFAADTEADLVVLGTVYRTGLDRLMMGSAAERILDAVACDVLAVKPAGFAERLRRELGGNAGAKARPATRRATALSSAPH